MEGMILKGERWPLLLAVVHRKFISMQRCPGDYTEIEWEWVCESLRTYIHMCDRSLFLTDTSIEDILKHTLQDLNVTRYCLSRWIWNFLEHKGFIKTRCCNSETLKITRQKLVTSHLRWVLKISTQSAWIPQQQDLPLIREHNKLGQLYMGFGLSNTMSIGMKNSILKATHCSHLMGLATAGGI